MTTLKKVYSIKMVKYNFAEPFMSMKKDFETYPTEQELENTLIEFDEKSPLHKSFGTTLHIEEYYKVIRS